MKDIRAIVVGGLNTDIVAQNVDNFPKPGGYVRGKNLLIGAGGKSRNIASMLACLLPPKTVAMVSRTVQDEFGLWKVPIESLQKTKVNTDYIRVLTRNESDKMPAIALIVVDKRGQNQIFVLPGISDDFNNSDIDDAALVFEASGLNNGMLILTLECPLDTAIYCVKQATRHGLRVVLDPGGIQTGVNMDKLLRSGIFLIKPNEHEAEMLTGVRVTNMATAELATRKLQSFGIDNVLITAGAAGAFLFTKKSGLHISVPAVNSSKTKDETGCGDQTMAALCAGIIQGADLVEATKTAVLAGTLQFHKHGITPVTPDELRHAAIS